MDLQFVRDRISALRIKKNVSEYKMSLDLGHSKGYMQNISSGRAAPSLNEFLYLCSYLGVHPKDFFDEGLEEPQLMEELNRLARRLSEDDLKLLVQTAQRLSQSDSL